MAARPYPLRARSPRSAASVTSNSTRQQQQVSLAKRLLFPNLSPGSDLPPLFTHPSCPRELDEDVYDFIALALRAFVHTWWAKITRYDKDFLPEVTNVLIHVIRVLEARLLSTDLSPLVFCDIPALVTQHYRDYRLAASKISTSYAVGGALSLPQLFHQLQSHMALSPDGQIDEEYFRQAVDHILRVCLPSEDYAPEAERFIIREIVVKVIVQDVIPRVTQPWFLHKLLLDSLGPSSDMGSDTPLRPSSSASHAHSSHFSAMIVQLLSAIQSLSGACLVLIHAYKQTLHTIKLVNGSIPSTPTQSSRSPPPRTISPLAARHNARPPSPTTLPPISAASSTTSLHASLPGMELEQSAKNIPCDLVRAPLALISEIFHVQSRFSTTVLFQAVSMFCSFFHLFMNKLLSHLLYTRVFSASSILSITRLCKRTLFPNGYPGTPLIEPTPEQQIIIRQQLIKVMAERLPAFASSTLLGPSPYTLLDAVLDPLSERACNAHLVVFIFDALLLTIFPEMGVEGAVSNVDGETAGVGVSLQKTNEDGLEG
ncbi:PXA domain-containing protein [Phlebopus sp. FC_14]|nr:PXA domain-containing protein [Phlebopus sp. FC_14]